MTHSKMKVLPQALLAALIVTPMAFAQQTPPPVSQKVEKVEVTGSNIKRVDVETIAPIQIITREEIQQSGRNTIAEVLRDLSVNQGGGFNEQSVNSFAPGATGISLRGLGAKNTLVLINGRRLAGYGFAQGISDTFVDVNQIPASAVERIEVLKSGASHIYGSDAIAGVINVIMRKDFHGLDIGGSTGRMTDASVAKEYTANLTAGYGDPGRDKYNLLVSADYFKRDLLRWTDLDNWKNGDFRKYLLGDLSRATLATYFPFGSVAAAPNPNRIALAGCTGEVLATTQLNPYTATRGTTCVYNPAQYNTILPRTERVGVLARGGFDITPTLQAFAEAGYSRNKSFQTFSPGFVNTSNTYYDKASGNVKIVAGRVPADSRYAYVFNGSPVASNLVYTFTELGGRDTYLNNESSRVLVGLKGTAGKWDWEAGATGSRNEVTSVSLNRVSTDGLLSILANNTYNYFNRNDPANAAALSLLRIDLTRTATSKLQAFDAKASTELMQMAGGPLGFAVGMETRKEDIKDRPDQKSVDGKVVGQGSVNVDGTRRNTALFAELSGNVVKNFEVQTAVRFEHYSDFGSKTVPGIGAKWTVAPEFLLRANFSRGFRAPTLPENSKSSATFFTGITDPVSKTSYNVTGIFSGAGNLKPETSNNVNYGAVWEATKNTNFSLDFYYIKQKDIVSVDDFTFILNHPERYPGQIVRDPLTNLVQTITARFINLQSTETNGFDFEARQKISLNEYGKLTLSAVYSYVDSYKSVLAAGEDPIEGVASNLLITLPRYRGTLSALWERGDWAVRLTNRHIDSYNQTAATASTGSIASPEQQTSVGARDYQDLFVGYRGIKNLSLSLSIVNLKNALPPYDGANTNRYASSQYDARGRYATLGAQYSFK